MTPIEFSSYETLDGLTVYVARATTAYCFESINPFDAIGQAVVASGLVELKVGTTKVICDGDMTPAQRQCLSQIQRYKRIDTPRALATAQRYWDVKWPGTRPEGEEW